MAQTKEQRQAFKAAKDAVADVLKPTYFDSVPLTDLFAAVESKGVGLDPEETNCILCGAEGRAAGVGNRSSLGGVPTAALIADQGVGQGARSPTSSTPRLRPSFASAAMGMSMTAGWPQNPARISVSWCILGMEGDTMAAKKRTKKVKKPTLSPGVWRSKERPELGTFSLLEFLGFNRFDGYWERWLYSRNGVVAEGQLDPEMWEREAQ